MPRPAVRDTTGEWLKCNPENVNANIPVVKPSKETVFDGDISPNANNKPNNQGNTLPNNNTNSTPPNANSGGIVIPPGAIIVPEDSFVTPMEPVNRPSSNPTTVVEPPTRPVSPPNTQRPTQPVVAEGQYHVVAQGETLWAISRKYGLTVDALKLMNNKVDNIIKPGDRLRVK